MVKGETLVWSLTIGVDSQAVMQATRHRRATPGQHLIEMFHGQIAAIWGKHPSIEITLRWMPGHAGIPGNEQADQEAKWVAKGQLSAQRSCQWQEGTSCHSASRQHVRPTGRGLTRRRRSGLSPDLDVKDSRGSIQPCHRQGLGRTPEDWSAGKHHYLSR